MKKKVGIEIGIGIGLIILLSIIGISYALLRKTVYGESGKIILHGGKLDVILEEDSIPTIALTNAKPTKDADGAKSEQVYRFTVVNNSDSTVHYKIYLDDDNEYAEKVCGDNCSLLLDKDVKYEIKTNNSISVNTLDERKLREEFLEKKERKTYEEYYTTYHGRRPWQPLRRRNQTAGTGRPEQRINHRLFHSRCDRGGI